MSSYADAAVLERPAPAHAFSLPAYEYAATGAQIPNILDDRDKIWILPAAPERKEISRTLDVLLGLAFNVGVIALVWTGVAKLVA